MIDSKDNAGDYNAGDWNAGDDNAGNGNAGDDNAGSWNAGNDNAGNGNAGSYNAGNGNAGSYNAGDYNAGNWNAGGWNTGNRNAGGWNAGNCNAGYFNIDTQDTIRVFGVDCKREDWIRAYKPSFLFFDLTEFIIDTAMTNKEKSDHPKYKTTGGYLKKYEYKEAFKKSWDNASDEDKELLYKLPNFNADIFKEISGIDVNEKAKELTVSDIEKLLGHKVKIVK